MSVPAHVFKRLHVSVLAYVFERLHVSVPPYVFECLHVSVLVYVFEHLHVSLSAYVFERLYVSAPACVPVCIGATDHALCRIHGMIVIHSTDVLQTQRHHAIRKLVITF